MTHRKTNPFELGRRGGYAAGDGEVRCGIGHDVDRCPACRQEQCRPVRKEHGVRFQTGRQSHEQVVDVRIREQEKPLKNTLNKRQGWEKSPVQKTQVQKRCKRATESGVLGLKSKIQILPQPLVFQSLATIVDVMQKRRKTQKWRHRDSNPGHADYDSGNLGGFRVGFPLKQRLYHPLF